MATEQLNMGQYVSSSGVNYCTEVSLTTCVVKHSFNPMDSDLNISEFAFLLNPGQDEKDTFYAQEPYLLTISPLDSLKNNDFVFELRRIEPIESEDEDIVYKYAADSYQVVGVSEETRSKSQIYLGFTPMASDATGFNAIVIRKIRRNEEGSIDTSPIITAEELEHLSFKLYKGSNIIDSLKPSLETNVSIKHLGIWGSVGLYFSINGEIMSLNSRQFYEIINVDRFDYSIDNVSVFLIGGTGNYFTIDYQYVIG